MSVRLRVDTVFIPAVDSAAAADWYCRIFGLEQVFVSGEYFGLRVKGAGARSTALTIFPAATIPPAGYVTFNFFSPDPEALRDFLLAENLDVTAIQSQEGMRYFDFVDPSGNRINICNFPEHFE